MEMVCRSDKGLKREINEDSLAVFPEQGMALLADGVGGHNAGETASYLTIEAISADMLVRLGSSRSVGKKEIARAVRGANRLLRDTIRNDLEMTGMATTIVLTLFFGDRLLYAHVGDSRLYRFRDSKAEQLTTDHSVAQALVDRGMFKSLEEAASSGVSTSALTRGLGVADEVEVEFGETDVRKGDIYLLCSDGLSGLVSSDSLLFAAGLAEFDMGRAADRLISLALEKGGIDNVSLIMIRP